MISINVSAFVLTNVIDSCALWNILSSRTLYSASQRAKCAFCFTDYVRYECLHKKRTRVRHGDPQLQDRMRSAIDRGEIRSVALQLEDLQELALLRSRGRVSKGELSAIVFAKRAGLAFLTDDQGARRLAREALKEGHTQTTPHLLGWLLFSEYLSDGDKVDIVREHEALEGSLTPHLERAYQEAMRCRLMARPHPQP